jgi:hypothetical protein
VLQGVGTIDGEAWRLRPMWPPVVRDRCDEAAAIS